MSAQVIHVREMSRFPNAVYIGRRNNRAHLPASPFASPFAITERSDWGPGISRHAACLMYRDYLLSSVAGRKLLALLPALRGKPLACWCRTSDATGRAWRECHGDQLVRLLDEHTDAELRAMAQVFGVKVADVGLPERKLPAPPAGGDDR